MSRTKSALSLTLVVSLAASALPATAQGQTRTPESFDLRDPASQGTVGPIARAATREAIRLADAGELTSSSGEAVQQSGKPAESDWSRARELDPGTEITHLSRPSALRRLRRQLSRVPQVCVPKELDRAPRHRKNGQGRAGKTAEQRIRQGADGWRITCGRSRHS